MLDEGLGVGVHVFRIIMSIAPNSSSAAFPRMVIVSPTFNNERDLPEMLSGIGPLRLPIIVVNDGSTDDTGRTIDAWRAERASDRYAITHPTNRGKAAALLSGFAEARRLGFTHTLTIDSDGQHAAQDLQNLVGVTIRHPRAIIVGARPGKIPECPLGSFLGRRLSNHLVWLASGVRVTDSQSGMRSYPLELIEGLGVRAGGYAFETEVLARAGWAGLSVIETPIGGLYRVPGGRITHFRIARDTWEAVRMHARLIGRSLLPGNPVPRVPAATNCDAAERPSDVNRSIGTILHRALWWLGLRRLAEMATGGRQGRVCLAASVGVGLFMATIPVYGIKTIACLWLAAKFRLHPTVAIAVSSLSTPPLGFAFAFASLFVGHALLRGSLPKFDSLPAWSTFTLADARTLLTEWIAGSIVVGIVLGLLGYGLTRMLLHARRHTAVQSG